MEGNREKATPQEIASFRERIVEAGYTEEQATEALRRTAAGDLTTPRPWVGKSTPAWVILRLLFGEPN